MAILRNCEIWFPKLDPERPNARHNKDNPTWELQMRTTDKDQKKEWNDHGIKTTAVREDKDDEESPVLYYRANVRRKTIKANGDKSDPVSVINGKMEAVDPTTIGNGSIANLRIFNYDWTNEEKQQSGTAAVLMGVQLLKQIPYEPAPRDEDDEFTEEDFELVDTGDTSDSSGESGTSGSAGVDVGNLPPAAAEDKF